VERRLELHFVPQIVDWNQHATGCHDAQGRDDPLRTVRRPEHDCVASANPFPAQPIRKGYHVPNKSFGCSDTEALCTGDDDGGMLASPDNGMQ
jgi:hypothetical protein